MKAFNGLGTIMISIPITHRQDTKVAIIKPLPLPCDYKPYDGRGKFVLVWQW